MTRRAKTPGYGATARVPHLRLVRNGFEVAWLDDARRNAYLDRLNQHLLMT